MSNHRNIISLRLGDCFDRMAELEEGSVVACVCDPPYGISFMGKEWDDLSEVQNANRGNMTSFKKEGSDTPKFRTPAPAFDLKVDASQKMQVWHKGWLSLAYQALRPGGVIKAFSATRTFHRLAAAMEEVGFENVELESWNYGSGFPKSLNVAKAMDKASGAKRGTKKVPFTGNGMLRAGGQNTRPWMEEALKNGFHELASDEPVTDDAKLWSGWGTALKPAWEPFVVGRKPL